MTKVYVVVEFNDSIPSRDNMISKVFFNEIDAERFRVRSINSNYSLNGSWFEIRESEIE